MDALEAVAEAFDLSLDLLCIVPTAPEDFFLFLPDEDAISRVLRASGIISIGVLLTTAKAVELSGSCSMLATPLPG